jgi:hypothetical protein
MHAEEAKQPNSSPGIIPAEPMHLPTGYDFNVGMKNPFFVLTGALQAGVVRYTLPQAPAGLVKNNGA